MHHDESESATAELQADLDAFSKWCGANKLTLNPKKTKQVNFGSRHQLKKHRGSHLFINGKEIMKVPSFKYLGIMLDPTLTFNLQIGQTCSSVGHKMYMLCKIKRYLNKGSMISVYKSMVLPFFDYGDVIISGANCTLLGKLQKLQDRCLRICLGVTEKCDPGILHNRARVAKLEDHRRMHINNFMFKRKEEKIGLAISTESLTQTRISAAPNFSLAKPSNDIFKRESGTLELNNGICCLVNIENWIPLSPLNRVVNWT